MESEVLLYLVLGSMGAERHQVVSNLIRETYTREDQILVGLSNNEDKFMAEEYLAKLPNVEIKRYDATPENEYVWEDGFAPDRDMFIIADGEDNCIDQVETFFNWQSDLENVTVERVVTILDTALMKRAPKVKSWYDACIHFSDVVLLSNRKDVDQKWTEEFIQAYKKDCYPCHFKYVKKGRAQDPLEVLHGDPRRLTHIFDEWISEVFLEEDPIEEDEENEDEVEHYFERIANGERKVRLPDICNFV